MPTVPIPENEAERLRALHAMALLDTPREPRLDRLALAAARIFRVPMAIVGLIDAQREWFKACVGVDDPEMPRELTFCAHTIAQDGAFVVEDTHEDPLFADHPMVVGGPRLRFYAGWPLHGPGGHKIGTLCVADTQPHRLSDDDRLVLQELAGLVESELNASLRDEAMRTIAAQQAELIALNQRLAASDARHRLLAEAAFEGLSISDGTTVLEANMALAQMLGYAHPREVLGLTGEQIVAPECLERVRGQVAAGRDLPYEAVLLRRDGSRIDVELVGRSYDTPDGPRRATAYRDNTERKRLDAMKGRFLSMVSHDLKNPLGSLALSLTMLRDALVPGIDAEGLDDARFSTEVALRSVRRLVRLADGLLDFERMEAGAAPLAHDPVPIEGVFQDAIGSVIGTAQAAGVTLAIGAAAGTVPGDRDRLVQVFTNLVGNAVKFSPRGGTVTLSAARTPDGQVALRVDDEGRGIPADMLEAIFERFTQVEADDARVHGGTGLGLSICRAIVKQHGGTIRAGNRPSGGASFVVQLPGD